MKLSDVVERLEVWGLVVVLALALPVLIVMEKLRPRAEGTSEDGWLSGEPGAAK